MRDGLAIQREFDPQTVDGFRKLFEKHSHTIIQGHGQATDLFTMTFYIRKKEKKRKQPKKGNEVPAFDDLLAMYETANEREGPSVGSAGGSAGGSTGGSAGGSSGGHVGNTAMIPITYEQMLEDFERENQPGPGVKKSRHAAARGGITTLLNKLSI